MSAFRTALAMERADKPGSGKWVLLKPLVYYSDILGKEITVPAEFETDLASVPRLPIIFWLTGATADEAAVIHDYLYTTRDVSRSVADAVMREASAVMGTPGWQRGLMWFGVRVGGRAYWKEPTASVPDPAQDVYFG